MHSGAGISLGRSDNKGCFFLSSANLEGAWLAGGDFEWQEGADSTELRQAAVAPSPQTLAPEQLGAASPVHLLGGTTATWTLHGGQRGQTARGGGRTVLRGVGPSRWRRLCR